ncbi:MAG: hypothetical protein IAX21_08395 [Candidatus Bathyarchaeota archaeon]|nr:MAG: hypothetical protein IAX21_08395 [Candidatus Bathyarchaeota archaeon]
MPLDKTSLFDFLEVLDKELEKKITLVAVGGTAMTLLDLKSSTIDIDFTIPSENRDEYEKAVSNIPHGLKIDVWDDGIIFSQILPSDYLQKSVKIKEYENIKLLALNPVDIIVTKIGRSNDRDLQDIQLCITKTNLSREEIITRGKLTEYVGNRENYDNNLNIIIGRFFTK